MNTIHYIKFLSKQRCSFRQYNPKKPAKYGIELFDCVVQEPFTLQIYPGHQQPSGPYQQSNKVIDVENRMVEPIIRTGRKIARGN